MIVVMKSGSTPQQVEHVIKLVKEMGLKENVIVGTERTVVAVIGNDRFKDRTVLESAEGACHRALSSDGTYTGVTEDVLPNWDIKTYEHASTGPSAWAQGAAVRALAALARRASPVGLG